MVACCDQFCAHELTVVNDANNPQDVFFPFAAGCGPGGMASVFASLADSGRLPGAIRGGRRHGRRALGRRPGSDGNGRGDHGPGQKASGPERHEAETDRRRAVASQSEKPATQSPVAARVAMAAARRLERGRTRGGVRSAFAADRGRQFFGRAIVRVWVRSAGYGRGGRSQPDSDVPQRADQGLRQGRQPGGTEHHHGQFFQFGDGERRDRSARTLRPSFRPLVGDHGGHSQLP